MPSFNWNGYYLCKMFNSKVANSKKKCKVCYTVSEKSNTPRLEPSTQGRLGYQTSALPIGRESSLLRHESYRYFTRGTSARRDRTAI